MSFQGMRDLPVRWISPPGPERFPVAPAGRGQQARRKDRASFIVRDESHRLSLGELLSSSARFRFAGWSHRDMNQTCGPELFSEWEFVG
jgi:hypothetical protein